MKQVGDLLPAAPTAPREPRRQASEVLPAPTLPRGVAVETIGAAQVPKPIGFLLRALQDFEDPHPDVGANLALATDPVREEAARHLRYIEALLACESTAEHWMAFMLPLAILPGGPDGRNALAAAVGPIVFALGEKVPHPLLTPVQQKRALTTLEYWPKPKALLAFFAPTLNGLLNRAMTLRKIVKAEAPRDRAAIPPVEREAVRNQLAALGQSMRAELAEQKKPPRPVYLKGDAEAAWRAKQRAQTAQFTGKPADTDG